ERKTIALQMLSIKEAQNWYTDADPVHDFAHVLRVYHLATRLAKAEGADIEIVQAAALLHDSCGSAPGGDENERAGHHITSAEFAGKILNDKGWAQEKIQAVQHCIRTHRYRGGEDRPQTLEAQVLFDADKLDVLGAIGAARTIAYAALDGQPLYAKPSEQFLQTGRLLPDEPHSSYHEYLFKLRHVKERMFTKSGQKMATRRHRYLVEFYDELQAEVQGER
ncbi:MAG: HD domain-containing protein, partial [Anaerolineales bacterium]